MTLYLVIVKENLPWLVSFVVISTGTIVCLVLRNLRLLNQRTFVVIAVAAFIPWLVSLLVFAADATSRNSEGKRLTVEDD